MAFWKTGNTDAKAARIGMSAEIFDETHKIYGLRKCVPRMIIVWLVARWITSESENIADSGGGIALEDGCDLFTRMTHAS